MRRSVIVEYDPRRELLKRVALGLALLTALGLGIVVGGQFTPPVVLPAEPNAQFGRVQKLDLQQQLINAEMASQIDRIALETVRAELAAQRDELAELSDAVRFYRKLMAPNEVDRPLSVGAFEILANTLPGRYHFRIVIQQTAIKHVQLRGHLSVELEGVRAGKSETLDLAMLSEDVEQAKIPLQFKYFQSIEGDIDVPEGFVPAVAKLKVTINKPKAMSLENNIPWQAEN